MQWVLAGVVVVAGVVVFAKFRPSPASFGGGAASVTNAGATASSSFVAPTIQIVGEGSTERLIHGEKILIATGSSPLRPPDFPFEDYRRHDSNEILDSRRCRKKLVVIGGGVIGSEYAGTFAALGAEMHLVDGRDTQMPFLDVEISRRLADAMTAHPSLLPPVAPLLLTIIAETIDEGLLQIVF